MWKIIVCGVICFTIGAGIGALIMGFLNAADIEDDDDKEN